LGTGDVLGGFDARVGAERDPVSFADRPGGNWLENLVISCSPSLRVIRMVSGLYAPALLFWVPAITCGANGGTPPEGHAPPSKPFVIANGGIGGIRGAPSGSAHGLSSALTVYSPHPGGLTNGEVAPEWNLNVNALNGSGGRSSKLVTSRPVAVSAFTSPSARTTIPRSGSRVTIVGGGDYRS
jgi:hypothetical protein